MIKGDFDIRRGSYFLLTNNNDRKLSKTLPSVPICPALESCGIIIHFQILLLLLFAVQFVRGEEGLGNSSYAFLYG